MALFAVWFAAFAVSLALVPVCRHAARRWHLTAKPSASRWHQEPTALMGGVAIGATVFIIQGITGGWQAIPAVIAGTVAIFVLGLWDDLVDLKPYAKLVVEIAVAALFVYDGYRLSWVTSLTLDTLLTMVWIVGLTNALNLLDNMDGLCAGTTLIAGSSLLVTLWIADGASPEAVHLAIVLGATAGFLVFNFHPASIFMGDSGSLMLGLTLAVLTLDREGHNASSNVLSVIAGPLLVLLIPIFDTTLVTLSRLFSGRSAAEGGRDHTSHRLVAIGLSERYAVAVLWTLAALGGLLSLAIRRFQDDWISLAAAAFLLVMILLAVYLGQVRVYEEDDPSLQGARITPFVSDFLYKRRVAEVLLDFCLVSMAYYASFRLRYSGPDFGRWFAVFLQSLPAAVGLQILALFAVGGYRGVWRYFGLIDGFTFAKAVGLGTAAIAAAVAFGFDVRPYPREVFVIYAALLMLALIGSRASFRLIGEFAHRRRHAGRRLIIYGASDAAAGAARELLEPGANGFRMVGFIHDDPMLARTRIQGYPVLGDIASLESLVANDAVDLVVVTALIDVERLARLRELCEAHGVSLARLRWQLDEIVAAS